MRLTEEQKRLVEDNIKIVYSCLKSAGYTDSPKDLEQEAMLALCIAAINYDDSKGQFSTYAFACVSAKIRTVCAKSGLWSATRKFGKGKMYEGFRVDSLNRQIPGNDDEVELIEVIPSVSPTPEDIVIAKFQLSSMLAKLSDTDKSIVLLRLQGYTFREIAKKVGFTATHVCRRFNKFVENIKS